MVIGKIKPTATVVAQFAANVEVDAIQHEGKIFLPVLGLGEFASKDETPKKTEPVMDSPKEKTSPKSAKDDKKSYTEDELMDMDTKDLLKLCKSMGIDPDATDGKNTNKKLRLLILNAQDAEPEDAEDEEEEQDEEPAKSSKKKDDSDDLTSQVVEILEDFDGGKKNKKKTISAILALSEDADEEKVEKLVDKFEDDADVDLDEIAEKIVDALNADEDEDESPKAKKGKTKEALVDAKDLKVGDKVSVWWDDDNQAWYDGVVKSISKKGVVTIDYDDDTTDTIDPEIHTKIKLIK